VAQTNASAIGDHDDFVVKRIIDIWQPFIHARGWPIDLGGTFHPQGFVRTLVVEDFREVVEPHLLLQKI
jgi:hypothetical protein